MHHKFSLKLPDQKQMIQLWTQELLLLSIHWRLQGKLSTRGKLMWDFEGMNVQDVYVVQQVPGTCCFNWNDLKSLLTNKFTLRETTLNIFLEFGARINSSDNETCHRVGPSNRKKIIIKMSRRKRCRQSATCKKNP